MTEAIVATRIHGRKIIRSKTACPRFGNQTRILAGGNALEEYDYFPSDGPLSEVKYATGEVLKNSYDKYEQNVEQKWNGTTVFRNVYDDYGNVFYHEDLENDRKIFFEYDLIQRMAGYRTTDGETARIQYDNKNRRTGMVHQIDDSRISTSCVFGEVGKAQAPDVIYQIKVNDAVKISYTFVPGRKAGIITLLLKEINNNGKKAVYHYDSEGHRVQWKDLNGTSHKNYWCGNKLMGTKYGDILVQFVYGADKSPLMLKKGEKEYYYLYNSQNDVIGLIDSDGKQVVNYSYDAWGKQTGLTDTSGENIGKLNPFRYRSYCYDDDTKLYVTASRYYDPELCRFLCADNFDVVKAEMFSMNGKNLYVYCCNNPVNAVDEEGSFGISMLKLAKINPEEIGVEVALGVLVYLVQCGLANEKVTLKGLAEAAVESAIGCVFEGGESIVVSMLMNGAKGIYSEYQESGNVKRAASAGIYEAIMTVFEPKTYTTYVEDKVIKRSLGAFSDFFQSPLLGYPRSSVLDGVCGKPKKRENKNGSTLKKNGNTNFSTKKGREKKNWQNNKSAISGKMQRIGFPALR